MEKRQTLRLSWRNQAGRIYSITINNPVNNVTPEQIEAFMNMVVQKNIVKSSGGDLVAIADAHLVNSEDYDLYTPA
ncbi:DUF2922 domain-containing protein [bacterium]|nr:DUF2922 domain-containing protein [bacterium]